MTGLRIECVMATLSYSRIERISHARLARPSCICRWLIMPIMMAPATLAGSRCTGNLSATWAAVDEAAQIGPFLPDSLTGATIGFIQATTPFKETLAMRSERGVVPRVELFGGAGHTLDLSYRVPNRQVFINGELASSVPKEIEAQLPHLIVFPRRLGNLGIGRDRELFGLEQSIELLHELTATDKLLEVSIRRCDHAGGPRRAAFDPRRAMIPQGLEKSGLEGQWDLLDLAQIEQTRSRNGAKQRRFQSAR